jgi:hypothetical protein
VSVPGWIASFGTLMASLHQVPGTVAVVGVCLVGAGTALGPSRTATLLHVAPYLNAHLEEESWLGCKQHETGWRSIMC